MLTNELKDKMWQLRQRQNLSELMPLYSELKLKHPNDQEVQCLEASLYRSRGEIRMAQATLKALRISDEVLSVNPRVFMEEGLNYLYQGDSFNGLEKFLACYSLIKNNPEERLLSVQSLINAMIALDNLGMNYSYTEKELNNLKSLMEIPAGYLAVVDMIHLCGAFRNGDFKSIDEVKTENFGQAKFFKYYVGLLPYHRYHYPNLIAGEIETLFSNDSDLYLKSYRLRTLQKCMHPEDEKNKKVGEVVDRLYLWIWQFMLSPSESEWSRIVMTFNHLEKMADSHLTVDDSDKFVCALGWLGLIDPLFEKASDKIKALFKINEGSDQSKLHQLEKLVIHYLKAKLNNEFHLTSDYLKILRSHPLYDSPDIKFKNFIEDETSEGSELISLLNQFIMPSSVDKLKCKSESIVIDLRNNKIQKHGEADLLSENMCQAFCLLYKNESVSDNEFCSRVFGIQEFDPVIHNSKLFTILWRMKKTLNDQIEFKVKNGRIYGIGNWKNIQFIELPIVLKIMREKTPNFYKNYADSQASKKKIDVTSIKNTTEFLLSVNETLTRAEIENRIGKSRPTCNRMISKWRSLGLLEMEGSGPSTRYRISKNIECRGSNEA